MDTVRSTLVPGLILGFFFALAAGTMVGFGDLGGALATARTTESARQAEITSARMRTAMKGTDDNATAPASSSRVQ
jgi:hypothetical protein